MGISVYNTENDESVETEEELEKIIRKKILALMNMLMKWQHEEVNNMNDFLDQLKESGLSDKQIHIIFDDINTKKFSEIIDDLIREWHVLNEDTRNKTIKALVGCKNSAIFMECLMKRMTETTNNITTIIGESLKNIEETINKLK
jgi:hypothetical protein